MSLKITAGLFKGRTIISPKDIARPTSSMMRQALFNIISNQIDNAYFLDLFAGSGIMGLEALSRGAKYATFIEKNKQNATIIQKNLSTLNFEDSAKVICMDVLKALLTIDLKFNIVFMDPPYSQSQQLIIKTLNELNKAKIIQNEASIFIETSSKFQIEQITKPFQLIRSKKYGSSTLHQYSYLEDGI